MNRWKAGLLRLVRPRLFWLIPLSLLCAPALVYLFYRELDHAVFAYPIYGLSAYTLAVWCLRVPAAVKRVYTAVYSHHLGRRYMTDLVFRGRLSLHISTWVNLCYALFKLFLGLYYRSLWFGAIGAYYICLTVIRALLLRGVCQKEPDQKREYQTARMCGGMLFLLTAALSVMVIQMAVHGKGYQYPGTLIFVVALYAFYAVTMAVIDLIRFRKLNSPALSASKTLGLAAALVSMLSLQTAMFASFGGTYQFQQLMNALTGGAVCLLILLMAILMVVYANRAIKKLEINNS